jgi:hypothetical protein
LTVSTRTFGQQIVNGELLKNDDIIGLGEVVVYFYE